jgi:hypothetical protein
MRSVWYCCPIKKNWMCRHISPNLINHKFHENWLSGSRDVTSVRTQGADAIYAAPQVFATDRHAGRHFLSQTSVAKLWNVHTKIFPNRTIGVHKYSYVCRLRHALSGPKCKFWGQDFTIPSYVRLALHCVVSAIHSSRAGGVTVTPCPFIREVLPSKLGRDTIHTDWGISWSYSALPGKFRENTSIRPRPLPSKYFTIVRQSPYNLTLYSPAVRSKAWTVFARSNTGIVGSNPTQGMDVCLSLICVCVVMCVGSGLPTGWSLVQEVLPSV